MQTCHPERSEGSRCRAICASRPEILHCAQDDMMGLRSFFVKLHDRIPTHSSKMIPNHAHKSCCTGLSCSCAGRFFVYAGFRSRNAFFADTLEPSSITSTV